MNFSDWHDAYSLDHIKKQFANFKFVEKDVTLADLEDTVKRATALNSKYIGRYTRIERYKNYALVLFGIIFISIAIAVGMGEQ